MSVPALLHVHISLNISGAAFSDAWNDAQVEINRCSRAHTYRLMVALFMEAIPTAPVALQSVLKRLCDLFALANIENDIGAFMQVLCGCYLTMFVNGTACCRDRNDY